MKAMKEVVWARVGSKAVLRLGELAREREVSVSEYIRQLVLVEIDRKGGT